MKEKDDSNSVYPPAVTRALNILDYFAENTQALSIKEISEVLEIPHASAYRLVKCLVDYGYLRESPNYTDKYKLGFKPSYLSKMAFDGVDLITIAIPHLKDLANQTSQACQLCVLNDGHIITLDQSLPRDAITIIAKLGEPIPVNVSASGKVLYSRIPESKRRDMLTKVWHTYSANTEHTVMDMEVFLQRLDQISTQTYATDFEEFAHGIGCLAVPIYDNSNKPIAAIGLTGQVDHYKNPGNFDFMLKLLLNVSSEISKELYYC